MITKIIHSAKHPLKSRMLTILCGLCEVTDGLLNVLTLGTYGSSLCFHVCCKIELNPTLREWRHG